MMKSEYRRQKKTYFIELILLLGMLSVAISTDYKDYDNEEYYANEEPHYVNRNGAGWDSTIYDYYEDEVPKEIKIRKTKDKQNSLYSDKATKCGENKSPILPETIIDSNKNSNNNNENTNNNNNINNGKKPQKRKSKELRDLVQHLHVAQARVKLEASEIKKAQEIAKEAQHELEESANHVRAVAAVLQSAQQEVATSAIRAQTAQLQLAAHDQLLFAARQDVDALSSQMVGMQTSAALTQPKINLEMEDLMEKPASNIVARSSRHR